MKTRLSFLLMLLVSCENSVHFPKDSAAPSDSLTDSLGDSHTGDSDTHETGDTDDTSDTGIEGPWTWDGDVTVANANASFLSEVKLEFAGSTLTPPGDLDGDGFDDLLVGAFDHNELVSSGGKIYVVWGRATGWHLEESLGGYPSFVGDQENMQLSFTSGLGDLDGDGLPDFSMESGYSSGNAPPVLFVAHGKPRADWASSVPASEAEGVIFDRSLVEFGHISSNGPLGDMDGDGLHDLFLYTVSTSGTSETHVVSGPDIASPTTVPDSSMLYVQGRITTGNFTPYMLGDVTGDGLADLGFNEEGDFYYVVPGRSTGFPLGVGPDSIASVRFASEGKGHLTAHDVGDVNGDGVDDLYVHQPSKGLSYLYFGGPDLPAEPTGADADVTIVQRECWFGGNVGDLDGDGIDELAFTHENADHDGLHIFFGRSLWPAEIDDASPDSHIMLSHDDANLYLPSDACHRGDINGDGIGDLFIFRPYMDVGKALSAGVVMVFLGQTSWPATLGDDDIAVRFVGSVSYQDLGSSGWFAVDDLNGDGRDDVITSSFRTRLDGFSETSIFFGQPAP